MSSLIGHNNDINIALSGWSGAGTTVMTLMLAVWLKRRYYPITRVFREVVRRLDQIQNLEVDQDLPHWEAFFQPALGKVVDLYADHLLTNDRGLILESDLSVFRLGLQPQIFSVFLKANFESRVKRFINDGRVGGEETLKLRDKTLQEEYLKLWKFDIFDEQLITKCFDLVIDNSRMTIAETFLRIMQAMHADGRFNYVLPKEEEILELVIHAGPKGKEYLREQLRKQGLLVSVEEMVREINQLFKKEVALWPEELHEVWEKMG